MTAPVERMTGDMDQEDPTIYKLQSIKLVYTKQIRTV